MSIVRFFIFSLCLSLFSSTLFSEEHLPSSVNINTANAEVLSQVLSGVGDSKARAIVAYRKTNGLFKSVDDLVAVKGIGESLINKNRGRIKTE
ncbi:MAG: competence protein ComEA [Gammaproteobacteria bacterium]|jgi:competence protein ComEA